jgi:hypothetical protein
MQEDWVVMRAGDRVSCLVVLIAFVLVSAQGDFEESSGVVVSSRGDVSVITGGESRPLKQGDFIHEHDEIIVSTRSFVVLQLVDGAKLTLRPDSDLIIEQYHYGGPGEDSVTLNLISGSLGLAAGAIASSQPENYRIRTSMVLMSVQGRESSLSLCGDEICGQKGLVEIPQ